MACQNRSNLPQAPFYHFSGQRMVPLTESLAVVLTFPKSRSTINFMGFNCDISHWCLQIYIYIYTTLRKKQNSSLLHFGPTKTTFLRKCWGCLATSFSTTIFWTKWGLNYIPFDPQSCMIFLKKCVHQPGNISTHPPTCRCCPSWGRCCMARSRARKWPVRSSWAKRCQLRWTKAVDFTSPEVLTLFAPLFFGCKMEGQKIVAGSGLVGYVSFSSGKRRKGLGETGWWILCLVIFGDMSFLQFTPKKDPLIQVMNFRGYVMYISPSSTRPWTRNMEIFDSALFGSSYFLTLQRMIALVWTFSKKSIKSKFEILFNLSKFIGPPSAQEI